MNLIKNVESKIKLTLYVSIASFVTAIIICTIGFGYTKKMIAQERNQIYVIDNNIPLVATRTNIEDNREAEYKADIEAFHDLFFSLPPDNDYIEQRLSKAMFLIDATGVEQYNTLKEKGYYANIISSSSMITCTKDSILINMNTKKWTFYGKEKIERPSTITIRSLVTEGYFQDVQRTENNPHGVLITQWKTIENKDLSNETKKLY